MHPTARLPPRLPRGLIVVPDPDIVADPAAITPAWLSEVLQAAGHDVVVETLETEPVGTGQMAHNERFILHYGGARGDAPGTLVGKFPSPNAESRAAGGPGGYRNEVRCYTDLAETLAVRTPRCYYGAVNDESTKFTLILEDLAPARQGDQLAGCSAEELVVAARNLAGLHAPRWCDPTLRDLDWLQAGNADQTIMLVQLFTPMFVDRYADRLTGDTVRVLQAFGAGVERWLATEPERFTITHGDYRLDNLMFYDDDRSEPVAAVDWQTVAIGSAGRDLAYLLGNSVEPRLRREAEPDVRAAYHARLLELGVADYSLDDVVADERHGAFQGPFITMLGAIAVGRTDRGDDMFVAMAERSATQILDLEALDVLA
jgi:hypothetical protein